MNEELANWQKGNDEHLAAALEWLRLRLAAFATAEPESGDSTAGCRLFRRKERTRSRRTTDKEVERAARALADAEQMNPPPALLILSQRFGLSSFEREVLLLCGAMELDTRIAGLCARAQDNPNRPYPTFALALALFEKPTWDVLSPERPLRYWRMIEINQSGAQPLTTCPLRADERIVNYLKGLNYLDDRLPPLLVRVEIGNDEAELPPSQRTAMEVIVHRLEGPATTSRPPIVQLVGTDPLSKQLVAWHAVTKLGLQLFRLPAELLPTQPTELETLARLWRRESILLPIAIYLDAHHVDTPTQADGSSQQPTTPPLHRFLANDPGLIFLDTREIRPGLGRDSLLLDIDKPTPAEQQTAWAEALNSDPADSPAQLASQFNLNLVTIRQITERVLFDAGKDRHDIDDRLWDACLIRSRPRLDQLAQHLDPKATWDDIVLPKEQLSLLHQIAEQVGNRSRVYDDWGFRHKMNRGLGINVLFAGESGTGKTMAAEVMANDLRLNLYRIDLSAVVNKYIGETEKNLRRLFDAAEDGGVILFFDEADALFGKRSEVRDSHDRYANIEINYLLQRMEAFRGLAILATNMKSALDQAFLRRLRFIVNFPFPGPADRKRMWEKVFPSDTPLDGLDFDRLARLNLTGGGIHNIALNAAFLAAEACTSVNMLLVLSAARAEFRKLERPVNEAEFRWEEPKEVVSGQQSVISNQNMVWSSSLRPDR